MKILDIGIFSVCVYVCYARVTFPFDIIVIFVEN